MIGVTVFEMQNDPKDASVSSLTDSLRGILSGHWDLEKERDEGLRKKYGIAD